MKSLRRSLNNNGASSSSSSSNLPSPPFPGQSYAQGINPLGRPSEKVAPPQKVIKALNSHRSTNPQELSYTKGDFWYVTGEREGWFEALSESYLLTVVKLPARVMLMCRERPVDGLERVGAKGGF
jgi:bud emergence protein 1